MIRNDGAFQRAPRPLIGWATALLCFVLAGFVIAVLAAIAIGFWKTAAQGQGVPDMTGGLAALIAALVPAWGISAQWMHTRSSERRTEIAYGRASSAPPFVPANDLPPSPDGGPRPGDSA